MQFIVICLTDDAAYEQTAHTVYVSRLQAEQYVTTIARARFPLVVPVSDEAAKIIRDRNFKSSVEKIYAASGTGPSLS